MIDSWNVSRLGIFSIICKLSWGADFIAEPYNFYTRNITQTLEMSYFHGDGLLSRASRTNVEPLISLKCQVQRGRALVRITPWAVQCSWGGIFSIITSLYWNLDFIATVIASQDNLWTNILHKSEEFTPPWVFTIFHHLPISKLEFMILYFNLFAVLFNIFRSLPMSLNAFSNERIISL